MFVRTKRLTLRHGWPEDASALSRAIGYEHVVTKLSRAPWPYSLGDAQAFLGHSRSDSDAVFVILSHDGSDHPALIGGIGICPDSDGYELGYWLTPSAWGRGYATEAGHAVLDAARHALGIRRVHARHFVDNPASGRVLIKLGFRATGEVRPLYSRARAAEALSAEFVRDLTEPARMSMAVAA